MKTVFEEFEEEVRFQFFDSIENLSFYINKFHFQDMVLDIFQKKWSERYSFPFLYPGCVNYCSIFWTVHPIDLFVSDQASISLVKMLIMVFNFWKLELWKNRTSDLTWKPSLKQGFTDRPGTERSDLVRDFQNSFDAGSIRNFFPDFDLVLVRGSLAWGKLGRLNNWR